MDNANGNNVNEATNGGGNYLMLLLPPEVVSTRQIGGELLKRAEYKAKLNSFDWGHVSQWAATLFREIYRNFGNSNFVADEVVMGAGVTVAKKYGEMTVGQFGDFVGRWINGAYGTTAPNQPTINQTLNVYAFDVLQKQTKPNGTAKDFKFRVLVMEKEMELGRRLTNHEKEQLHHGTHGTINVAEIVNNLQATTNPYKGKLGQNNPVQMAYLRKISKTNTFFDLELLAFKCPGVLTEKEYAHLLRFWEDTAHNYPAAFAKNYNDLMNNGTATEMATEIPGTTIEATKEKTV